MRLRTLLRILAAVVTAGLAALAAVGAVRELNRAAAVQDYADTLDQLQQPSLALVAELQAERRMTALHWARGPVNAAQLGNQQALTDEAAVALREVAEEAPDAAARPPLQEALRSVAVLEGVREQAAERSGNRDKVLQAYTLTIEQIITVHTRLRAHDASLSEGSRPLAGLLHAGEALAIQDTLLAGAQDGRLPASDHSRFAKSVGMQWFAYEMLAGPLLPSGEKARFDAITTSAEWTEKSRIEDAVLGASRESGSPVVLPAAAAGWQQTYERLGPSLAGLATARIQALADDADDRAGELRMTAYVTAAGGVVLVAIVLLIVLWISRAIVRRAEEVRSSALAVARRQLPQMIVRLQRGEDVDLSVLPGQVAATDEFGEISNVVARLAEEVVDAARMVHEERFGFEKFAEGVTLRAVTLIVNVLHTLDELQHRYADTDPALLAELYELDHLTVRVRRQLENLLVLSGGSVVGPHTEPVHIANLIVDAAGESRGFAQVTKEFQAEAWVVPEVAGELTHLIAELIENATTYSPSGYEVFVRATHTATGVAIEVEDKGRAPESWFFEALNGRLLDAPPYSVLAKSSDQLGLFVVGQLAQRHGVRVTLQQGRFGGVLAVVLIPSALLTGAPEQLGDRTPARKPLPARSGPRPAKRREPTAAGLVRREPARAGGPAGPVRPIDPAPGVAPPRPADDDVPAPERHGLPRRQGRPTAPAAPAEVAPSAGPGAAADPLTEHVRAEEPLPVRVKKPHPEPAPEPAAAPAPEPAYEPTEELPLPPATPETATESPREAEPAPERPAARVGGLPQRVPGTSMAGQLRDGRRRPATAMDRRPLDSIESAFTQLQEALTDPEEDSDR
ncbi:nitrate- and nitrite sensing domain-containing protein [Streptomyces sp. WMMC500]|uniref:sensor histidine kinase n=1 Tax=Streptomyces sp. WMMC500 TaxID=3015154 RepID=UPI00248CD258|nr:nitrate- and nitrite sensing domain-containing protein [Streptomyces sp. WMMC500]WBB61469.1 nitrate- and nitrite sensing domain-containing protein [Streptomyces sp. WMMC500]